MKDLVSVEWLYKNLNNKDLILLDASLVANDEASIPGARFFDLKNKFSDQNSQLPNTFPSQDQFEKECQKLGVNRDSKIVVFDNRGIYSSPRVWWMFKSMGHDSVSVLDGGLPSWVEKGYSIEKQSTTIFEVGNFEADFQHNWVKRYDDIVGNVANPIFTIVDARAEGRFNGTENEPRKHLKSGHIPGSINIHYQAVLSDGKYKSKGALKEIFDEKCISKHDLVFSCGSGITACIVLFACHISFKECKYVYDGSWTEWAEGNGLIKNAQKP